MQPREYCYFDEQKRLECKSELDLRRVQGSYFKRQLSFGTAAPMRSSVRAFHQYDKRAGSAWQPTFVR
jgi:hypothetical protein